MDSYVIDTNVLITANGKHKNASDEDAFVCQNFLVNCIKVRVSIDSMELIFKEYFTHASLSGQPGIGDAFLKRLWDNQYNDSICEQVDITPHPVREFEEFPDDESLADFDRDDRKFVAVAVGSRFDAVICNATDTDWWDYRHAFKKLGITIQFLCPELMAED